MRHNLTIDFRTIGHLPSLLYCLSPLYNLRIEDSVDIHIVITDMVYPEYLLTTVGIIRFIRSKGICVNAIVHNNCNNTYVQRVNFYHELGIPCCEDFTRRDPHGRFVEITQFNDRNSGHIVNDIMQVIRANYDLDQSLLGCLNYCLWEMVDNVQIHANSPIDGFVVVQNYPQRSELRIAILDAGRGIYASLQDNPQYANINPSDALAYCVRKHVTSGKGLGRGLYDTVRFMTENGGDFQIYSGNHCLSLDFWGSTVVNICSPWQGTLIFSRINTNIAVDPIKVFEGDIPTTVSEYNECIDGLW